jgi:hypothetical protein
MVAGLAVCGFAAVFSSLFALGGEYPRQPTVDPATSAFVLRFGVCAVVLWLLFVTILVATKSTKWRWGWESRWFPSKYLPYAIGYTFLAYAVLVFGDTLRSTPGLSDSYKSYQANVNDEAAAAEAWLKDFSVSQGSSPIEPPAHLSGEYLELATGPYTATLASDGPLFLKESFGLIHAPMAFENYVRSNYGLFYKRYDTAAYIAIVRTYAEYQTSTNVTVRHYYPATGLTGAPFDSVESAKVCSVVATVVDRATKSIVASRDFPSPARWFGGSGIVSVHELSDVETWLAGLGLHESQWLRREPDAP